MQFRFNELGGIIRIDDLSPDYSFKQQMEACVLSLLKILYKSMVHPGENITIFSFSKRSSGSNTLNITSLKMVIKLSFFHMAAST